MGERTHPETNESPRQERQSGPAEPGIRDSSDIIEGDIGEARLKQPSDASAKGADLDKLPPIDPAPEEREHQAQPDDA